MIFNYVIFYSLFITLAEAQSYNANSEKRNYMPLNRYNNPEPEKFNSDSKQNEILQVNINKVIINFLKLLSSNGWNNNNYDRNDKPELNRWSGGGLRGDGNSKSSKEILHFISSNKYPYLNSAEVYKQNLQGSLVEDTNTDVTGFSNDYFDTIDLMRSSADGFSKDYLDYGDLVRREKEWPSKLHSLEVIQRYVTVPRDLMDLINSRKTATLRIGKGLSKGNAKSRSDSSDSSEASAENHSGSVEKNRFKVIKTAPTGTPSSYLVPKRITKDSESSDEDMAKHKHEWKKKHAVHESTSLSDEEPIHETPKWKKKKDKSEFSSEEDTIHETPGDKYKREDNESMSEEKSVKEPFVYMQGRDRIWDNKGLNGRKRLEHFMPKRFHWDADEIKTLGYFWFNGDKGKFAEPWRSGVL